MNGCHVHTVTIILYLLFFLLSHPVTSIKFEVPASLSNSENNAREHALSSSPLLSVLGTVNGWTLKWWTRVSGNTCLSKRDINGETGLAITAHADGDVGGPF
ncbi:hypothetical protein FRC02_000278 [Tulasnella sp. 418]|nr:hypothetical protein FRC02_000278 [Tulasnella sp. 418]